MHRVATPVHRGHVRCTGGAPQNGAFFFFSFVLGLVFYEIRKEKGRNGEDNKDNKMNRKWKRKKEMKNEKEKMMTKNGRCFKFCIKGGRRVR